MNKPLIRSLMFACAASMALPAQGVMVARKKAQDPKPKAEADAKVDMKALHEKLMEALSQADLSDAERAQVMETLAKVLHKAKGEAVEVRRVQAIDVVADDGDGDLRVFVVGGEGGKDGGKRFRVHGHQDGEEVQVLGDLPLVGKLFEKRVAKLEKVAEAPEGHGVWVQADEPGVPAAKGEKQYRINVVGQGAGEQHEVTLEEVCEEACEEGEAPKVKVLRRVLHGEPIEVHMGEIEIAEPMILELKDLELKIDERHKVADVQRKKADELRARAEKLRAAVAGGEPAEVKSHDVRVYLGDLAKSVDITGDVQIQVDELHEAIAKAHGEALRAHSAGGDGAMVFEWVGEAPKPKGKGKSKDGAKTKGKARSKDEAKAKAKAKADDDGDMADMIRELREEMRELRQMMKQIRKELREEDEQAPAPLAPLTSGSFRAPAVAPAPNSLPVPAVPPTPPVAPAPAPAPAPLAPLTSGSFAAPAVAPAPDTALAPAVSSVFSGPPAVAPARAHGVGRGSTATVDPRRQSR